MKFGIIHYRAPGATLEAFLDYAAVTGFDAVELRAADIWPEGEGDGQKRAAQVRKMLDERRLGLAAVSAGNDFVVLDEEAIGHQIDRMGQLSRLATIAGAKVLRTEGGRRKAQVPPNREGEAIAACLKRCVAFAHRDDIVLAVDNHGQVTNDPQLLIGVLRAVGSDRVGANLDTANFRAAGHSVEACRAIYDQVAPLVLHTHMKDCIGQLPDYHCQVLGEGEVDLNHAVTALKRAGYAGTYTAEWEGQGDSAAAYAACLAWMKQHID